MILYTTSLDVWIDSERVLLLPVPLAESSQYLLTGFLVVGSRVLCRKELPYNLCNKPRNWGKPPGLAYHPIFTSMNSCRFKEQKGKHKHNRHMPEPHMVYRRNSLKTVPMQVQPVHVHVRLARLHLPTTKVFPQSLHFQLPGLHPYTQRINKFPQQLSYRYRSSSRSIPSSLPCADPASPLPMPRSDIVIAAPSIYINTEFCLPFEFCLNASLQTNRSYVSHSPMQHVKHPQI